MTQAEYEALLNQTAPQERNEQHGISPKQYEGSTEKTVDREEESTEKLANVKQQVASIGLSTKRKSAKIVGDDGVKANDGRELESSAVLRMMKKKPKKRVKLSFDEDVAES